MKKFVSALLALTIIFTTAYAFPNSIWAPLEKFGVALNNGDDNGIYTIGKQLIDIMEAQPDSQEKTDFLAGKYAQIPASAERLGYLSEAVELYKKYLPYGELMDWTDGVESAKSKINALTPSLDVYVTDSNYYPEYYGAKFEPKRGVLFGSVYDNDSRIGDFDSGVISRYFPKKNSNYLFYLDYGEDIHSLGRYAKYFTDAVQNDKGVMFAFNFSQNPDWLDMSYIQSVIDYVASWNIPVFVRFGAEMNVSEIGANPDSYINLFRKVADYVHTKPNLATVWSPNDIGGFDSPFELYYPGDEYVDWVGVSHYVIKYFQGRKDHGDQTDVLNTYFATGDYANSLLRIKQIMNFMERNNIKKPVMLSECGVAHTHRLEGEDTTAWAEVQLARIYTELIKKYQNIKLVNYFNVYRGGEPYAFELFTNDFIYTKYNQLVENDYFLSYMDGKAPYGYRPISNGAQIERGSEISVVGYYPKSLYSTVKIKNGSKELYTLKSVPYTTKLNLPAGKYDLTFEYINGSTTVISKTISVTVVDGKVETQPEKPKPAETKPVEQDISIFYNDEKIDFPDQKPVIESGRTLVPARGVFEKMGLTVKWNADTRVVDMYGYGIDIALTIDSADLKFNGQTIKMDVPAKIINGRTMLPLRAISEVISCDVKWDEKTRTVYIEKEETIDGEYIHGTLDLRNLRFSYEEGGKMVEYNDGAIGGMNLEFSIHAPSNVRSVLISEWRDTPFTKSECEKIALEMAMLWKNEGVNAGDQTPVFETSTSHPVWEEDLGKVFYVLLVGLDKNGDYTGYALIEETIN